MVSKFYLLRKLDENEEPTAGHQVGHINRHIQEEVEILFSPAEMVFYETRTRPIEVVVAQVKVEVGWYSAVVLINIRRKDEHFV